MFTGVGGARLRLQKSTTRPLVFPELIWRRFHWHQSTKSLISSPYCLSLSSVMRPTMAESSENFCRWSRNVPEVCSVQGEHERSQDCSLWSPCTADHHVQNTVLSPHILWVVGEVVRNPRCEVVVHAWQLQLAPQKQRLDGVENTGEVKECDSHSASRPFKVGEGSVQEEDDGVIHPDVGLVGYGRFENKLLFSSITV